MSERRPQTPTPPDHQSREAIINFFRNFGDILGLAIMVTTALKSLDLSEAHVATPIPLTVAYLMSSIFVVYRAVILSEKN